MHEVWTSGMTISGAKIAVRTSWSHDCRYGMRFGWATPRAEEGTEDSGLANTTINEGSSRIHGDCCVLSDIHRWVCGNCGAHLCAVPKWCSIQLDYRVPSCDGRVEVLIIRSSSSYISRLFTGCIADRSQR